jgi:hypothetical protein
MFKFFQNIGPWYMLRLRTIPFFLQNKIGFNVYFHLFLHSDVDVPHDHPWDSWSIMLWGNMHEVRQVPNIPTRKNPLAEGFTEFTTKPLPLFKPKFRAAEYRHVVKLNSKWAFTIFIPLRKKRTWYFYPDGKPVVWWDFLNGESRKSKPRRSKNE